MQLTKEIIEQIRQKTGERICNTREDELGFIAGVIQKQSDGLADYIILGSDHLFGWSTRYFAIPACSEMIRIESATIRLTLTHEQLLRAKRISLEKCPRPLFDLEPLIYELTDFDPITNAHLN
jgi:hypothetical protein